MRHYGAMIFDDFKGVINHEEWLCRLQLVNVKAPQYSDDLQNLEYE